MTSESKSIFIIGGGTGIGFEAVKYIVAEGSQSTKLVVFGLQIDDELQSLATKHSERIWLIKGDVTDAAEREKAFQTCLAQMGGIDTLVYTAGILAPIERIEKISIDDVKRVFEVNLFSTMVVCQQALPYLHRSKEAKVIILSSACDSSVIYNGWVSYCTSKAALSQFVRLLAHEEPNICVQGVYPHLTGTQMPADIFAGKFKGIMADSEIEKFKNWEKQGDVIEPAAWCGVTVAKLALGVAKGGKSGEILYHDEHVPRV
ncbi:NAD(P)-binding protein [Rhizodiscina lignyota]|uniref:NAD(P)-binding protein n=1 Tax=Rhizodiscina lignyota TaxID=1504668 RepID=A0A9P4M5S9_9PEZI|nr:NAD(P)-binding protein [Rhizodiscina lignyota]